MKLRNGILLSLLISFITGCSSTGEVKSYSTSNSTISSVQSTYQPANSYVGIIANFTQWQWYRLPLEDRKSQEEAMYFALNNVDNGESTSWYNNSTGTNGRVLVLSSYPAGSGYCRVVISRLNYKGKMRDFKETACKEMGHENWRFIRD
mgnify:FL=1